MGSANAAIENFKVLNQPTQTGRRSRGELIGIWGIMLTLQHNPDPLQPSADQVHAENCQCLVEFQANVCHEAFMEGYLQYSLHAQERSNIFRPSWINRVLSGLKSIGSVNAVIVRNTWNDIYRAEEARGQYRDVLEFGYHTHNDYKFLRSQYPLSSPLHGSRTSTRVFPRHRKACSSCSRLETSNAEILSRINRLE